MLPNRFIPLAALLSLSACKEQPPAAPTTPAPQQTGARLVTLTNEELQESLGILAWKFVAPREEGKRPYVLYEQYTEGERVYLMENGIPRSNTESETLVILRKEGDFYYHDMITDGSRGSGSWPTIPEPIKGDGPLTSSTTKGVKTVQNSIILLRVKHWKEALKEGESSSFDGSKKPNTEIILRVANDSEPLLYNSKGELKK